MTENEAIKELEHSVVSYEVQNKNNITCDLTQNVLDMAIKALEEIQQYRAIGTVEDFKALKEKSVAKKVVRQKGALNKYYHEEECPNCKAEFRVHVAGYKYTQAVGETHYCPNCGQKLDWQ